MKRGDAAKENSLRHGAIHQLFLSPFILKLMRFEILLAATSQREIKEAEPELASRTIRSHTVFASTC